MTTGIYKITNTINGNSYIGLSVNIENRWKSHIARSKNENGSEYDKVLYKAFRKYGIDNFSFEIIEKCSSDRLLEREKYWISFYDTYHHGYNCSEGGENTNGCQGEKHPNHKVTEQDVIYIRKLWASKTVSTREMYYEYQNRIGKSGFKKIYTWQTWKNILPELNTQENRDWHRENRISYTLSGELSPQSLISDKEEKQIYQRYLNGEKMKNIYKDYEDRYASYQSFYASMKDRFKKYQ